MAGYRLDPERFPAEMLVDALRAALADGDPGAAVVVAEPGSGKTTRLPLALLDEPWCNKIVLTAPRRVAASAAAERLASTLGETVGDTVGIRMRDLTRVGAHTRLEVVTEGVLVRMLQRDPAIEDVSVVVLDEVHERSLDVDLALALTGAARRLFRPDLRIVAMSATLDDARTATALAAGSAPPVLRSPGRTFPIEVSHEAPAPGRLYEDAARLALGSTADGDVLVFVPGAAEIRRVSRALGRLGATGRSRVLPLHGSGSPTEHRAALTAAGGEPRIVVATSIAQTSLTIPGVRTVVDTGQVRRSVFDQRTGMARLVTVPVSRATADQRAGRAGREAPGRCIRLWSATEHSRRAAHDDAEIRGADLEPLVLAIAAWGSTDPGDLPWIDPPPPDAWDLAVSGLRALGALDDAGRVTEHGRLLAGLPLPPRVAHLLGIARAGGPEALRRAAALATVLTRPELLGTDGDGERSLEHTVERLSGARAPSRAIRAVDELVETVTDGHRSERAVNAPPMADRASIGGLLSLVHPERIAAREGSDAGRYRLASGGIATMADDAPERGAAVIVVADLDGDRRNGRIWSSLVVSADEISALHRDAITSERSAALEGDAIDGVVRVVERLRLGAAVLTSREVPPRPDEIRSVLLDALDAATVARLSESPTVASLIARVEAVRRVRPADWPPMDAASLVSTVDEWLVPGLSPCPARAPLRSIPVVELLRDRVGRHRLRDLDRLAPESIRLPSGLDHRIDWAHEAGPTLTARVQELFGTVDSPRVVDGAVALRLELTSPAGRPAAVTDDLRRFWTTGYPQVRAELRGRYPKHPWPEDPVSAPATARTKPRPTR